MSKQQTETKQNAEGTRTEEFEISGDQVVAKIKELLHEGNVRRLMVQTGEGKTLFELPLSLGLAGVAAGVILAPVLTALGAAVAIMAKLKIRIERGEEASS
ncbi:MAG TPA: DUF4342 domain-containing protein [Anaerolineae bacterium]|jgi:Flp pilus assembly protein TadB